MVEAQARGLKPQHEGVAVGPAQARQLGMTRWAIGPAGCLTVAVGVAADREKSATGVLGLSTGRRRTVEMREQEEAQQSN